MNWYIKYPTYTRQVDYYIQPFGSDVWSAILIFVIFGNMTLIMMSFLKKHKQNFVFIDNLFVTFDCFCNQGKYLFPASFKMNFKVLTLFADGSQNIIFKTLIFSFRFLALFITAAYSAIILSFLTVQITKIPFRNVEEFMNNGKYELSSFDESGDYPRDFLSVSRALKFQNNKYSTYFISFFFLVKS